VVGARRGTGYQYVNLSGMKANTAYQVKVVAYNRSATSANSSIKSFRTKNTNVIKTPTSLYVYNITETTARLRFRDNATNEVGFKIYLNGRVATVVGARRGTGYQYVNLSGMKANTAYQVKVVAYNRSATSANSSIKSFRTKKLFHQENKCQEVLSKLEIRIILELF
ncbi:MAG: hypothetical protein DSZ07_00620, partial [Sulfurovum sp.]